MPSRTPNSKKRYAKIQRQFKERMAERTPSGARPSSSAVIETLSEDWCLSTDRISEIIKMKL